MVSYTRCRSVAEYDYLKISKRKQFVYESILLVLASSHDERKGLDDIPQ